MEGQFNIKVFLGVNEEKMGHDVITAEWCSDRCLIASSPVGVGELRFVAFVNFHGVHTPLMTHFKISRQCPERRVGER